jgi:SH3 domain-containing protein
VPGITVGGGITGTGFGGDPGLGGILPILLLPVAAIGGGILIAAYRRRRREDEGPAEGAALAAPAGEVVPALTESGDAPLADPAIEEDLEPIDEDAPLKKTRRASKKLAAGAAMAAAAAERRMFEEPPKKGVSRAKVGYRRVRISSEPDAVRSTELGRLDRGDEVEILESYEGFLQIRTPDNIVGWILRHTIVGAPT